MQKIALKTFIVSSIAFGVIGLLIVFTSSGPDHMDTYYDQMLAKSLLVSVFIILPSFAISLALKYLKEK